MSFTDASKLRCDMEVGFPCPPDELEEPADLSPHLNKVDIQFKLESVVDEWPLPMEITI